MRKSVVFAVVLIVVLLFFGCKSEPKQDIFKIVENNYDAIVTACEQKDEQALLKIKGVTKVNITDEYVVFFCKGEGISVSSQDYGFYYSEQNIPAGVTCNMDVMSAFRSDELLPDGKGYERVVDGNVFYAEHIKGKVYFYSNAY